MYFNWASYYIEMLKIDCDEPAGYGEIGRIVLADLHNYAFPVIRYNTCVLLPPDEYSNGYPGIGKLYGRRFDLTFATVGIPVYLIAYGRILKNYDCISLWQFVQTDEKEYSIRLVLNENNDRGTKDICKDMLDILGTDANISIFQLNR